MRKHRLASFNAEEDAHGIYYGSIVTRHHLGTTSQEASDPGAVSQKAELLAGSDLAENIAET